MIADPTTVMAAGRLASPAAFLLGLLPGGGTKADLARVKSHPAAVGALAQTAAMLAPGAGEIVDGLGLAARSVLGAGKDVVSRGIGGLARLGRLEEGAPAAEPPSGPVPEGQVPEGEPPRTPEARPATPAVPNPMRLTNKEVIPRSAAADPAAGENLETPPGLGSDDTRSAADAPPTAPVSSPRSLGQDPDDDIWRKLGISVGDTPPTAPGPLFLGPDPDDGILGKLQPPAPGEGPVLPSAESLPQGRLRNSASPTTWRASPTRATQSGTWRTRSVWGTFLLLRRP